MRGVPGPVEALLDTGFNGDVMLPKEIVQEAGLSYMGDVDCMTAGGDLVSVEVHAGSIRWLDRDVRIRILAAPGGASLLGMGLLRDGRLVMEYPSATLEIHPVPKGS